MAVHRPALASASASALVVLCVAALVSSTALAEPAPAARTADLLAQLDAVAKAAGTDCDAIAVAIDGWMDDHGEALRSEMAALEETGGGGDAANGERILEAMASLGGRIEHCGGHAGVASALARLDAPGAAAPASPTPAAAMSPGELLGKAPWGPACHAMLGRMDAFCKAHGSRQEAQAVCEAWTSAFAQVAETPSAVESLESGCKEITPTIDDIEKILAPAP